MKQAPHSMHIGVGSGTEAVNKSDEFQLRDIIWNLIMYVIPSLPDVYGNILDPRCHLVGFSPCERRLDTLKEGIAAWRGT